MQRIVDIPPQDVQESWTNKTDKHTMIVEAEGLHGAELKSHVETTLEASHVEETELEFVGTGSFFDEVLITQKYKPKEIGGRTQTR